MRKAQPVVVIFATLVLAGCQTASPPITIPRTVTPQEATTAPPAVPAIGMGTKSPAPPTSTAPAAPTATLPPEIVATKPEDVVGVWLVKSFVGQGGMVRSPADLTFRIDGTVSFDETDDPMRIFGGTVRFAEGMATIESDECYNEAKAEFYRCTMTFVIYSTIVGGKPVRIRLVSTGDKGVFITNVNDRTLFLDVP